MSAKEEERVDKKRVRMWAGPATVLYINFIRTVISHWLHSGVLMYFEVPLYINFIRDRHLSLVAFRRPYVF
jgi:hypothetical protein